MSAPSQPRADTDAAHPLAAKRDVVVHDLDRPCVEYAGSDLAATYATPVECFFLRSNLPLPPPPADPEAWEVVVEGVARPGPVTLAELRRLPRVERPAVLQCAGNGRALLAEPTEGLAWRSGAAANGRWAGARVADLVAALGGVAEPGAAYLTATGAEAAEGDPGRVERSVPLAKALDDAVLAYEVNGQPLGHLHGAPVRLVVPGYYGVNWVKFVRRLAFAREPSDARIMAEQYRIAPPGAPASPDQPSCWAMNVKSWITEPRAGAFPAGPVVARGVALSGEAVVTSVEVSTDGGATWAPAAFEDPPGPPGAWRRFSHRFVAAPGRHVLVSRATDAAGSRQPRASTPNADGYMANGWEEAAVELVVE